jgi:hypothetical protein
MTNRPDNTAPLSRRGALLAMAGGMAALAGCGGGGGGIGASLVSGLTSGGTGSFTTGTIAGLGSIIVNGTRYDDTSAPVSRYDDGVVASLRPGMVVSIQASGITASTGGDALPTATANRIAYGSEWVGPVGAVDAVARTLTVLGQTVDVPATAVFEGNVTDLSLVTPGQIVEVHGYLNLATGHLLATRVEVSSGAPSAYRLSGQVSALNTTTGTFSLGTALVGYDATVALPAGWATGQLVRIAVATTQVGGTWRATRIRARESHLTELQVEDRSESEIKGTVTSLDGTNRFSVGGIPVDSSAAQVSGTVAVGTVVEVHGAVRNGVIVATRVDVENENELQVQEFDFFGTVSNLNVLAQTFTLKGVVFSYTSSTRNEVSNWITGATPSVRVRASLVAGQWVASRIRLQS